MFHIRLKEERAKRKLSQEKLGEIVGVTQQSVNAWEHEKALPDVAVLISLADYFNMPLDYLVGRDQFLGENPSIEAQAHKKAAEWVNMLEDIAKAEISQEDLKLVLEVYKLAKKKNG